MRADARRNQTRILDAAREQITAHGPDVSMEQIASAAGVAVGTLYRHYATKTHLVEAIHVEYSEALLRTAEDAAGSLAAPGDAMARIVELLENFVESASTNRAFKDAAAALDAASSTSEQDVRAQRALRTLIDAAVADGQLRDGVSPDDLLLVMLSAPTDSPARSRARYLEICIAGITTP